MSEMSGITPNVPSDAGDIAIEMAEHDNDAPTGVVRAMDQSREAKARRMSALDVQSQMKGIAMEFANNGIVPDKTKQLAERRADSKRKRSSVRMSSTLKDTEDKEELTFKEEALKFFLSRTFLYALMWVIWLIVGTVFYCLRLNLTVSKGFYQSVNVGYSVGWGDISEIASEVQLFSTIYVCVGASFVGAGLGFFAEGVVADVDNWYVNAQQQALYDLRQERTRSWIMATVFWFAFHWEKVRAILLWLVFIIVGTAVACDVNDWPFITGLYFSTSSLSTGGLVALPTDAEDWTYGMLGLYGAIGIPLMAIAMGTLAGFFINVGDIEDTYNDIKQPVTDEELDILEDLGLVDDDGHLDKLEFIIMCMVRMGTDPALIHGIKEYFDEVDVNHDGKLSIEELHSAASRKNKRNNLSDIKKIHALGVKVNNFHHPVVSWLDSTFSYGHEDYEHKEAELEEVGEPETQEA